VGRHVDVSKTSAWGDARLAKIYEHFSETCATSSPPDEARAGMVVSTIA
jgi:hypothetical protein